LTLKISDVEKMVDYADSLNDIYGRRNDYIDFCISIPMKNGKPMPDYHQAYSRRTYKSEDEDYEEFDLSAIEMTYGTLQTLSDDERKAVIGHEVAHKILHGHNYRLKLPGNAGRRQKELEADSLALIMTRNAKSQCSLFGKMHRSDDGAQNHHDAYYQEILNEEANSTHPTALARAQRIAKLAETLGIK
jgi:Zn-dependent protease with chaperone function